MISQGTYIKAVWNIAKNLDFFPPAVALYSACMGKIVLSLSFTVALRGGDVNPTALLFFIKSKHCTSNPYLAVVNIEAKSLY